MEKPDLHRLNIRCHCNPLHPRLMDVAYERTQFKVVYQCLDCGHQRLARWDPFLERLTVKEYE